MLQGAEIVTNTGGPKISAAKHRDRSVRGRPGANVIYKRIKEASMEKTVNEAVANAKEAASVVGRWLLFGHLTPFEAEGGRRYAHIMGRFDRYFTEGQRTARAQSYQNAYGEDQELERRKVNGSIDAYEKTARRARRQYDKLQAILANYADPISGRNFLKDALDQMCCEDVEPPAQYRADIAAALRHVGKAFGVMAPARRGRKRRH